MIQAALQRFRRSAPEPSARAVRDDWLEWLRLSNYSPLTKGYRLTTDRLLARWPEIAFSEFTDDHILGIIEESKPASRQARRSAFQSWFQWGVRTKRIERDPMRHVPTYKPAPRPPIEWFISEVQRHRELGIPLGCCDEWPECSHILAYYEEHRDEILGRVDA